MVSTVMGGLVFFYYILREEVFHRHRLDVRMPMIQSVVIILKIHPPGSHTHTSTLSNSRYHFFRHKTLNVYVTRQFRDISCLESIEIHMRDAEFDYQCVTS